MDLSLLLLGKNLKPLTETPEEGSVSQEYFLRMMSPEALLLAKQYDDEEKQNFQKMAATLPHLSEMNCVVVGAGPLSYLDQTLFRVKNYIAIEPLSDLFVTKPFRFLTEQFPKIHIKNNKFDEVNRDELPEGNALLIFTFNILAYIDHPIRRINAFLRPGDVIFISTWNNTPQAKAIRKQYFDFLNSFEKDVAIDPEQTIGLCNLDVFPFRKLNHYKSHTRIKNEITDTLIIYT
jgi:hypothetical protein